VFFIYLKSNNDLCHLYHKQIGFYNQDEKYLLRGTDWVFKQNSLRFVFKEFIPYLPVVTVTRDVWGTERSNKFRCECSFTQACLYHWELWLIL